MIAVGHPDLLVPNRKPAVKQPHARRLCHIGPAKFCRAVPAFHMTAQHRHHHLLPVTNPQHRQAHLKQFRRRAGGACIDHAGRPAGQDHRLWRKIADAGGGHMLIGVDFTINRSFTQSPRDQLGDLRAKIDDQQAFVRRGFHGSIP